MPEHLELKNKIDELWLSRPTLKKSDIHHEARIVVDNVIGLLDDGKIFVTEKQNDKWIVNEWIKKAILLSFQLNDSFVIRSGQEYGFEGNQSYWYDKIPSKFSNWDHSDFELAEIRSVPGSFVRYGSFIGKSCILMPCFVNIGAYVGSGTMVDTWSTIGSCARIGDSCHISGGVGIGGVLEPLQANPVIIENNCFIGARSEIAEGVIVEEGSVIGMGVFLSSSTRIFNRETKEVSYGRIPAGSVVVSGSMESKNGCNLYCAVIVKTVDAKTRSKTSINELLRS